MIKLPVRASESVECILDADGDDVVIRLSFERTANGGTDFSATKVTRDQIIQALNGELRAKVVAYISDVQNGISLKAFNDLMSILGVLDEKN